MFANRRNKRRRMTPQPDPVLRTVSRTEAEQWLTDRIGPKFKNWQVMNDVKVTSELLNQAFGTGFSAASIYRDQRKWEQGKEFLKVGGKTSYDVVEIVRWILARQ